MKYNQPYDQPSSPNAPYVDGNPAAGIQGSIVPAAAIEYPQRELIAAIQAAGLAPTNADLAQLVKALKVVDVFNAFKMGVNQGSATQWSTSIPALPTMPPPAGTALWFKPGYASVPGGTVFSVNGSPFRPVTNTDLSPIAQGDIIPTGWLLLFFDGTEWQVIAGATSRQTGSLPMLQAPAHWYVNGTTGNDTNFDGTTPTVSGTHGPFKTIQRAVNETLKYNMNGYDQFIHVADGIYASVVLTQTNGAGTVYLIGNESAPQNCAITTNTPETAAVNQGAGQYGLRGFRLSATGSGASDGIGCSGGHMALTNCRFGPCTRFHMSSAWSAYFLLDGGTIQIEAGATTIAHMFAALTSNIAINPYNIPALAILGAVNITGEFCGVSTLGVASVTYTSQSGRAFVHGPQYNASSNGVIQTFTGGPNFFPGDSPGSLSFGGQYIP